MWIRRCIFLKTVILAGGLGTRISEQSHLRPKPMIEIGGQPILWHIMKSYSHFGINEFIICAGYKQHIIKEFFADYFLHMSDITFDLQTNTMEVHDNYSEPWRVTVVDTGLNTMTGGRVKRIQKYVENETFCLTYGDGVSDIDIDAELAFHKAHGKLMTLSAVNMQQRFGVLGIKEDSTIFSFREKSAQDGAYINGGFMICEPGIFNYIEGDATVLEREPVEAISEAGQMAAYKHNGFWQCMDTQRDMEHLEKLWQNGSAPWKLWED